MTDSNPSTETELASVSSTECAFGGSCERVGAGHALSFMQRRLAAATPSKWRDAIVTEISTNGRLRITTVDDGLTIAIWHHADSEVLVSPGDPVALHSVYQVLAVGSTWLNVLKAAL